MTKKQKPLDSFLPKTSIVSSKKYCTPFILLAIGACLNYLNRSHHLINFLPSYSKASDIQMISLWCILGISAIALFFKFKTTEVLKISIIVSLILIASELFLFTKLLNIEAINEKVIAYRKLNCKELEAKFEIDRQKNDFVFWAYGYGASVKVAQAELKEKYNLDITVIPGGCTIGHGRCYNNLLLKYLGEKK